VYTIEAAHNPEVAGSNPAPATAKAPETGLGSKGDAYDNAMAEAWGATFKSELVDGRRFPSFEHAEHEVLHWIGFYNAERLHEALGDLPPAEYEHLKYQDRQHPNAVRR
jgi:putative transposase